LFFFVRKASNREANGKEEGDQYGGGGETFFRTKRLAFEAGLLSPWDIFCARAQEGEAFVAGRKPAN